MFRNLFKNIQNTLKLPSALYDMKANYYDYIFQFKKINAENMTKDPKKAQDILPKITESCQSLIAISRGYARETKFEVHWLRQLFSPVTPCLQFCLLNLRTFDETLRMHVSR